MSGRVRALVTLVLALALGGLGCASVPLKAAENVDLERYMGDWYVLAHIPTDEERDSWNAVESYRFEDGKRDVVETTFSFRRGSFDGKLETLKSIGHVSANPARWGMKFYWWQGPFRFEYVVAHVDSEYRETVVARTARDYVWVMGRTPTISDADWVRLEGVVKEAGYDPTKLRRVPQRWEVKPDMSPRDRVRSAE